MDLNISVIVGSLTELKIRYSYIADFMCAWETHFPKTISEEMSLI